MTIEEIARATADKIWNQNGKHTHAELDAIIIDALTTLSTEQRAEGRREEASRISDLQAKLRFLEMAGRNTIKIKDVRYYLSQSE